MGALLRATEASILDDEEDILRRRNWIQPLVWLRRRQLVTAAREITRSRHPIGLLRTVGSAVSAAGCRAPAHYC